MKVAEITADDLEEYRTVFVCAQTHTALMKWLVDIGYVDYPDHVKYVASAETLYAGNPTNALIVKVGPWTHGLPYGQRYRIETAIDNLCDRGAIVKELS